MELFSIIEIRLSDCDLNSYFKAGHKDQHDLTGKVIMTIAVVKSTFIRLKYSKLI